VSFAPARWYSLSLDGDQVEAKLSALESHRTQAAVMDRLFRAFARPNEMFGVIDKAELARLKPGEPACGLDIYTPAPPSTLSVTNSPPPAASPSPAPPPAVVPGAPARSGPKQASAK
jgi:hypothetical protein